MTFSQFWSILKARKWAALLVFLLTVATTVAVSLLLPKQYTGEASVVIDVRPDPVSMAAGGFMAMPSFMATQVDVLTSERVALRVIRELRLLENPALRQQWIEDGSVGTIEQYLITTLQKQLDVVPSRESNVITISYKAPDPRFAAGLANAFAQAYIATTLELRAAPARSYKSLFDQQTQDARAALEQAQAKLSSYQREKGIIATDERLDVENARLAELSTLRTQLSAVAAESDSRANQAQGARADSAPELLNNALVSQLKADISRNDARLQELSARYGEAHPQVVEVKANLASLRQRLESESRRVAGGVSVNATVNRTRLSQVERELAAQRAKVLELKATRDEVVLLQRDVESAQRIYEQLALRQNQTQLETQNSQSYANQLTIALPPAEPSSPRIVLNTALSVFLGMLLAIGVALLLEMSDRRVRSPDDVIAALGLPVLGTLPTPKAKRYIAGARALPPPQMMQIGHDAAGGTGV